MIIEINPNTIANCFTIDKPKNVGEVFLWWVEKPFCLLSQKNYDAIFREFNFKRKQYF